MDGCPDAQALSAHGLKRRDVARGEASRVLLPRCANAEPLPKWLVRREGRLLVRGASLLYTTTLGEAQEVCPPREGVPAAWREPRESSKKGPWGDASA